MFVKDIPRFFFCLQWNCVSGG